MVQRLKFKWFESSMFNVRDWFKIVSFCFQIVESLRATTSTINIFKFYNSMIPTTLQFRA